MAYREPSPTKGQTPDDVNDKRKEEKMKKLYLLTTFISTRKNIISPVMRDLEVPETTLHTQQLLNLVAQKGQTEELYKLLDVKPDDPDPTAIIKKLLALAPKELAKIATVDLAISPEEIWNPESLSAALVGLMQTDEAIEKFCGSLLKNAGTELVKTDNGFISVAELIAHIRNL